MTSKIPDPYVPLKEASMMLRLTADTIRAKADSGELPHIRDSNGTRRFLLSGLIKYLQAAEKAAKEAARERRRLMDERQVKERRR